MFNFASNASFDMFRYESRVGNSLAYSTTINALYGLAQSFAQLTIKKCTDPSNMVWVVPDNVQNHHHRRMHRIGLENIMNLGMSATAWVSPLRHPNALDYDDKEHRRAASKRDQATVESLLRLLDLEHEANILSYQWLWVLGEYETSLESLKEHASMRLRTRGRKHQLAVVRSEAFPLPSCAKSENKLNEFIESIDDFMGTAGQSRLNYIRRLFPFGGDGLTYELFWRSMYQRQFHESPYTSLRILNPLLMGWHTMWTNNSRIIEKNLVSYESLDPSTLGNSASKIKRTIRIDQGKYDYNQGWSTVSDLFEKQLLEIFTIFNV